MHIFIKIVIKFHNCLCCNANKNWPMVLIIMNKKNKKYYNWVNSKKKTF